MTTLPQFLNYQFVKPVGFPSTIKQQRFTPVAFNTSTSGVASSDVVRFNISSDGYWDPYSAYIKIEVDVSLADGNKGTTKCLSTGCQQLDNSAQSFINQLIISKDGTEIERIEEYDVLAALLNDIHGSNDNRATRYQEGMMAQQMNFGQQYNNVFQTASNVTPITNSSTILSGYNSFGQYAFGQIGQPQNQYGTSVDPFFAPASEISRYEYTLLCDDSKLSLQSANSTICANQGILKTNAKGFFSGVNELAGYKQPFCPQLSSYGTEPVLSKNIPQFTTYKGAVGQFIYGDRQTFCIPLLSGLFGVLMPQESYKYIPMKALQDIQIEFRLNPHALFTSGYNDQTVGISGGDTAMGTVTTPMLTRSWKINRFELNVEMQYFENDIDNIILSRLNTTQGIVLHTQSWLLGPRYTIQANTNAQGTYQVNLKFESLKNVLFCFLPDDYNNYSFCRKQYRLSQNITSMYLKLGKEYFPPLPITGHAGNSGAYSSINNDNDASNSEFLMQLYSTFGKLNDINSGSCINSINFAVNQRPYNPTNVTKLWTTPDYTNKDTAVSQPLFHENRCVGRACYGINLESMNNDTTLLSGFKTSGINPYEITLKSDQSNPYPRSSTMYVFNNYDMMLQIGKNGIIVHGRQ